MALMDETREEAGKVFDAWFPFFRKEDEELCRERLFEYFHSGYLAGTRFGERAGKSPGGCPDSITRDDTGRNLDL